MLCGWALNLEPVALTFPKFYKHEYIYKYVPMYGVYVLYVLSNKPNVSLFQVPGKTRIPLTGRAGSDAK